MGGMQEQSRTERKERSQGRFGDKFLGTQMDDVRHGRYS